MQLSTELQYNISGAPLTFLRRIILCCPCTVCPCSIKSVHKMLLEHFCESADFAQFLETCTVFPIIRICIIFYSQSQPVPRLLPNLLYKRPMFTCFSQFLTDEDLHGWNSLPLQYFCTCGTSILNITTSVAMSLYDNITNFLWDKF